MSTILRYIAIGNSGFSSESVESVHHDESGVSYESVPALAQLNFVEEIGSLVVNFGVRGREVKVLESDALALITIIDGKVADIELLLDNKEVIRELSKALKPHGDGQ